VAPTEEKSRIISEEQLREKLTPEQFEVCINKGTERPFTGRYYDFNEDAIYKCVCCGKRFV